MNGVINIVTKAAEGTQGGMYPSGSGDFLRDFFQGRYGGRAGKGLFYRVYSQHLDHKTSLSADGSDGNSASAVNQGGFRVDWRRSEADHLTVQGDAYDADFGVPNLSGTALNG